MAKITRMPNRSPSVTSKSHIAGKGVRSYPSPKGGGWETFRITPDKSANENAPRAKREAAIRAKHPGPPKGTVITSGKYAYGSTPTSKPSMASRAASVVGKGAGLLAKGARIASPAGAFVAGMGVRSAGEGSDKPSGPLMKGNAPKRYSGPPTKTTSGGATRSIAGAGPGASRAAATNSASKGASSRTSGPPIRAQPSKANLGTSRFAKGGEIKRRKK